MRTPRKSSHVGLSVLGLLVVTFMFVAEAQADPITITITDSLPLPSDRWD